MENQYVTLDFATRNSQLATRNSLSAVLVAVGLLVGANAQALTLYRVTDLGDLPGGDSYSIAKALNEQGQVVGYSDAAFNSQFNDDGMHGFIWDAQSGITDLGIFSNQRMGYSSDINESGLVVGLRAATGSTFFRGFEWSASMGVVDLGVSGSYPYSEARAVNDSGYIVENNWSFSGAPSRVFLRSSAGVRTNIGSATGVSNPSANDINNANQIVGGNSGSGSAFIWNALTGMTPIAPLTGGSSAYANGINEGGTVVGDSTVTGGTTHAFEWDSINGIRDLGVLNAANSYSSARGINDANIVVGNSQVNPTTTHATLWESNSGPVDLNTLLLDSTGWQYLVSANAINNAGQIVGYGILANGSTHAFILDPVSSVPIPAAVWLFGSAVGGLAVFGRRKATKA